MTSTKETKSRCKNIKKLFPQSKTDWILYFKKTVPIIIGEILFCINGFLDNFMVSHHSNGIDALTYANTWTGILFVIFFAIQGIAAMFVGQYYGKKEYDKLNQIMNLRVWIFFVIAMSFSIPSWIVPQMMIKSAAATPLSDNTIAMAKPYLLLITISWLICSYNFNTNIMLNEVGHSNYALTSAVFSVTTNVTINAIFLYALKKPIYYAAIGSIISNIVCTISDSLFAYYKDRNIFINPFKLFHITKPIAKQILSKIPAMLLMIAAMITIPIRMILWSKTFPENSIGEKWMGISGVTILGLVENLSNVAAATTSACSSNVSYFVATELGKGNFKEAEKHAYQLKGFHTLTGIIMSLAMIGTVYAIAYTPTITKGVENSVRTYFEDPNNLIKIKQESKLPNTWTLTSSFLDERITVAKQVFRNNFLHSSFTFILVNPLWCWFYTAAALIRSGGRTYLGSVTMLITNMLSFAWLVIVLFAIVKFNPTISLPLAYFIFYIFDIIRFIIFEIVLRKSNWKQNITLETSENPQIQIVQ
ncbi:MATE family efflux transporter [Metamycoplasma hyosynoviae]|uniref:Na+-driven multidrug efflux pump n=1 Tax=Metamycoplasma hyosynoviae TaxID=29559 RepID=A0A4V3FMI2_9BACT|nr:MATE family efflux transporter [Metamycoplasma hyosynoviae]MDD1359549.1 MATE family efflux transporter [Metamycoplasma hyosynoviae]MDD1372105.1 MATE family efflux transporter [Metamycoplasma hyosynoviae]TDU98083.1 Na+-driven multidrug efflux pump [Metamycoplasma hyosynoviae]